MSDWQVQLILNAMSVMDQDRLSDRELREMRDSADTLDYVAQQYYYDQSGLREAHEMRRRGE